jgi:MoaA/NifB/PqqE/SkfB family radical SAM enzyme
MARALPLVAPSRPPGTWLELTLDYRCNLRCLGCHACHDTGETMSTAAAVQALRAGRRQRRSRLWLGGGEPTLRADLLGLVRFARELGYEDVLLQTNGMRLSYAAYRDAALAAGVTEIRVNVKSHRAEVHDGLSRDECHGLLVAALAGLSGKAVAVSADVLLTRSTLTDLPDLVPWFARRGVKRFFLWLLSASDATEPEVASQVPRFSEIVPALAAADAQAKGAGVEILSLHTPPCTLPPDLRHVFWPTSSLGLVVIGPDGRTFPVEASAFEGGAFLEGCARCRERTRCGGPRADYLRLHGASEFVPLLEVEGGQPAESPSELKSGP